MKEQKTLREVDNLRYRLTEGKITLQNFKPATRKVRVDKIRLAVLQRVCGVFLWLWLGRLTI
jgi:hypothetical protein